MIGIQTEVEYLRDCARELRNKLYTERAPGGENGIAMMVLRQASTLILNGAALAEELEAKRILENEQSAVNTHT